MTKEKLLQQRFKVIANYPFSPFLIGNILWVGENADSELTTSLHLYPHLFKNLHWSEERNIDDMPEYLKDNATGEVRKVYKHFTYITVEGSMKGEHKANAVCSFKELSPNGYKHLFWRYDLCTPSSIEEYIQYVNSKTDK